MREKVGSEGNDNSHIYVTHVHVHLHKTTADVYLNICLSQQEIQACGECAVVSIAQLTPGLGDREVAGPHGSCLQTGRDGRRAGWRSMRARRQNHRDRGPAKGLHSGKRSLRLEGKGRSSSEKYRVVHKHGARKAG